MPQKLMYAVPGGNEVTSELFEILFIIFFYCFFFLGFKFKLTFSIIFLCCYCNLNLAEQCIIMFSWQKIVQKEKGWRSFKVSFLNGVKSALYK